MNMIRTVRRDALLRMVMKGKIEARCTFAFTDGFPLDDNGRTDWMPARIKTDDSTFPEKTITFYPSDFKTKTGYAVENRDGTYNFKVHGNASYELRKKEAIL